MGTVIVAYSSRHKHGHCALWGAESLLEQLNVAISIHSSLKGSIYNGLLKLNFCCVVATLINTSSTIIFS